MTHLLDIGTDLDDLLASIGDLTLEDDAPVVAVEPPALINPRVLRGAWYA